MKQPIGANKLLRIYGEEIIDGEEAISQAFSELCQLVEFSPPPAALIHRSIRLVLSETALISLIFFPNSKKGGQAAIRAEYLRTELNVGDGSLLNNRTLRNHLMHLDERLDQWAMSSENRTFGRGMLGARSDALRLGIRNEDILGLFDPRSMIFCFQDDDLRIDDLVGEVRLISHAIRSRLRSLQWAEGMH